ncbi:hypothetical protein CHS0354_026171 [Potamilus streckersoni]|uniref:Uncharacterized protein n=1 Tax=Potamilus streckersoni TaxID=2493646 RepID=A0AAE0SAV5_9BIVA|nr:hypothetical protein CHS0354_026171 [Potamilus streckersoni]
MDLKWQKTLNELLTSKWHELKNTIVMRDIADHLIQKRLISLDYWMGLRAKPVPESERTEDYLSHVMKFTTERYHQFLEVLMECGHEHLVQKLAINMDGTKSPVDSFRVKKDNRKVPSARKSQVPASTSEKERPENTQGKNLQISEWSAATFPDSGRTSEKMGPQIQPVNSNQPILSQDKTREDILIMREEIVKAKEINLDKKEYDLKEMEKNLRKMQQDLKAKEDRLEREKSDLVLALKSQNETMERQLSARDETRMRQLQIDIAELREEIVSDKENRGVLHEKFEEHQNIVEELTSRVTKMEYKSDEDENQLRREITELQLELEKVKSEFEEELYGLESKMKEKENESEKLKKDVKELKNSSNNLQHRMVFLEENKRKQDKETEAHEKQIIELKDLLEQKEQQCKEISEHLADTEAERDDLAEEVSNLKEKVAKLQAEKRTLEQEKKVLLGRCRVPGWNTRSPGASRNSTINK